MRGTRPPELGVQLWEREPAALARSSARLERLGFAAVTVGDHLHPRALAPLTACAIVAGATSRVSVGPLVLNNDLRHPVVLAHEAAALAALSGGRFELGLGAGFARREYEAAGLTFDGVAVRAARLREAARILRRLLAGERVDLAGRYFMVSAGPVDPPPPRVRLLIGGNSPEVLAVAAECADIVGLTGFSSGRPGADVGGRDFTVAGLARQVAYLRDVAGPRFADLELHALVQWHEIGVDRRSGAERAAAALGASVEVVLDSPYVLVGTAAEIADQLRDQHERQGITRWTIFGDRPDLQPADALVPVLGLLG